MEMVPNESSAALLPPDEPVMVDRPRTMSAPLEVQEEYVRFEAKQNGTEQQNSTVRSMEEYVTFEAKLNTDNTIRHKSVQIRDAGARSQHAPVVYPR